MRGCDFLSLATPGVQRLQPYQPGKPLEELAREYGITEAVKLASNENPLGPSPKAREAVCAQLAELARYPDGNGFALKQALAARHGIATNRITLGNGSNDVLEMVARAFAGPEQEIVFSEHAFAVYPIVTAAVGARPIVVPAKDYGHDLAAMAEAIGEDTRIVFIANPNNPTGTWLGEAELATFLDRVPPHVLVVLDEAYYEYASDPATGLEDYPDGSRWLDRHPNLILTRTFSKAYGLAGLRVGYALSHPQVADLLNRVRQPFNVNSLALAAAEAALADRQHLQRSVLLNVAGLAQLQEGFERLGLQALPTAGNFVCVKVGQGMAVYEALLREGVIVRPVDNYGLPEYLRVSVGTEAENARFLTALEKVLGR